MNVSAARDTKVVIMGMGFGVILLTAVRDLAGSGAERIVGAVMLLVLMHLIGTINSTKDGEPDNR